MAFEAQASSRIRDAHWTGGQLNLYGLLFVFFEWIIFETNCVVQQVLWVICHLFIVNVSTATKRYLPGAQQYLDV
jgi:hypothetical protein